MISERIYTHVKQTINSIKNAYFMLNLFLTKVADCTNFAKDF